MSEFEERRQIAELNDAFRTTLIGGNVIVTNGILALSEDDQTAILTAVRCFDTFTPDNDPYGEHDFASLDCCGRRIFWKIDYYDPALAFHSENPADSSKTRRVLTIMLVDEY